MTFDEMDRRMRAYETALDLSAPPGLFLVARLDGRSFTRLTKETHAFEAPFDPAFSRHMLAAAKRLMQCGPQVLYAYTQSDEISLLMPRSEQAFGRRLAKLTSVLAGEASAAFSLSLGAPAVFDCRLSLLPATENVIDYFRWRQEDARRNALGAHSYWALREEGLSAAEAERHLCDTPAKDRRALLAERSRPFENAPAWQRRGTGLRWETYEKEGWNPVAGRTERAERRRIRVERDLPAGEAYGAYVRELLAGLDAA